MADLEETNAQNKDITPAAASTDVERQLSEKEQTIQQIEEPLSTVNSLPVWKSLKISDGDTALALFDNIEQLHEVVDPVEEKKLIRKIDFAILPCLAVCYAFYYVCSESNHRRATSSC